VRLFSHPEAASASAITRNRSYLGFECLDRPPNGKAGSEVMKILLAMDGSQSSEVALQALIATGHTENTEVRVMYVVEIWDVHIHSAQWNRERSVAGRAMWARGQETIARATRLLENAGFRVTTDIKEGDPRTVLIDAASEWQADLIMVGSHGRTGLDRLLMGSVSEAVARHAPCSVQIVRPPKKEPLHAAVRSNVNAKEVPNQGRPKRQPDRDEQLCKICGKPSSSVICRHCSDKVRAEAVARKKREDKGEE